MSHGTFTSTFPLSAVSPFSVLRFLKRYEDDFLEVVNPRLSLFELEHKDVISADVRTNIESANDEDAKYILLRHLQKNATVDTLRVYCDVAIAANGYSRMQDLGRKMMDALPPGGSMDMWLCNGYIYIECCLVHVCNFCVCLIVCMCLCLCACMHAYVLFVLLVQNV